MKSIGEFVNKFVSTPSNWRTTLLKDWPLIIGNLKHKVRIEKITKNLLILGVTDSAWLQELYLLSAPLIKTINDHLKHPYIKRLRFKNVAPTKKQIKKTKQFHGKTISSHIHLTYSHKLALKNIKDIQLRNALKDYLRRCYEEKK